MDVYINGMEMPPDGRYTLCITHDSDGCVHWVIQNQDTLEFLKHGAVIEIHEPHGRLIDADAYEKMLYGIGNRDYRREKGTIRDAMKFLHPDYTPTIIPASEVSEL